MDEDVLRTILEADEPKALRVVEPLHGTLCHVTTFFLPGVQTRFLPSVTTRIYTRLVRFSGTTPGPSCASRSQRLCGVTQSEATMDKPYTQGPVLSSGQG